MRVTIATLARGDEYVPVPGTEYEVAPGKVMTLRPPTKGLRRRYTEEGARLIARVNAKEITEEDADRELAVLVAEGELPEADQCMVEVVGQMVADFSEPVRKIYERRLASLASSDRSEQTETPMRPDGPSPGATPEKQQGKPLDL